MIKRAAFLLIATLAGGQAALAQETLTQKTQAPNTQAQTQEQSDLVVYKDPNCGCCTDWVKHVEQSGLNLDVRMSANMGEVKQFYGISPQLRSCHTAVSAAGYVFEGHVPAKLVQQFLANPPAGGHGLTVPAMPVGSPGMEVGDKFMPYQVLQLNNDGSVEVYASIDKQADQY
ncbi:DUF411 domain-containing protein [Oceanobacter mangrovi]|uniref:DUF411 domain-containing protein n=1 Tax=Oceanobacter mangrovi TaxID=2862510 RepID=UPI001C8EC637|nr:DUF411 domain-containing protein [Oceanobacter mangrovi]